MGIDSIKGAGSGAGLAPPVAAAGRTTAPAETFQVAAKDKVEGVGACSALDRLKAGEIDMNQYLELRVDQATSHLVGRVDAERLETIRNVLRCEIETDPMLIDLVQRATGEVPKPQDRG